MDTEFRELSLESSEVLGLESTARGIILRVEVEECLLGFLEIGREVHISKLWIMSLNFSIEFPSFSYSFIFS